MDKSKKKWEKPKLLELVRGKPEELVLSSCKVFSNHGAHGPDGFQFGACQGGMGGWCSSPGSS